MSTDVEPCLLYAFSGQSYRSGSFQHWCQVLGSEVAQLDILNDPVQHDLSDEHVWRKLMEDIKAHRFKAAIWPPPCGTFSAVRSVGSAVWGRPTFKGQQWGWSLYEYKC